MPAVGVREEREKNDSLFEVFDDVQAFLSDQVVRSIPHSVEAFFHENGVPGKLHEDVSDACLRYMIHGSFLDILTAREILQKHLQQQDAAVGLQQVAGTDEVALSIAFHDHCADVASHEVIGTDVIEDCPELGTPGEDAFCSTNETTLLVNVVADGAACSEFCPTSLQHTFDQVETAAADGSGGGVVLDKDPQQVGCGASAVSNPVVIEIHCSKLEDAMLSLPLSIPAVQDVREEQQFMEDATAVVVTGCAPEDIAEDGENEAASEQATEVQKRKRYYEEVTPFKYFCELCSFKTKRNSHYLKHIKIHEKVSTLHSCDKCSFTTVRLGHLRRHVSTHSNQLHRCTHCSYSTDDQKLLLRHNRTHHYRAKRARGAPAKPMECPHCSYRTTRPLLLARHRQRHADDSDALESGGVPLHQCAQCGYQTHRKEHLVRHRANVHGGARPFLCHRCGKAFKRGDALRQHQMTHASPDEDGISTASFPCPQCHKGFRTHSHLSEHQAIHSTARPFLCEICGSAFKTRSVQRKHVQSVHNNPRAFCCTCCSKKFNTQYALKRHQKLHLSPPPPQPAQLNPPAPPPLLPPPEEPVVHHAHQTFQDVLGSSAPAMSGPVAEVVPGLEHVMTVPIQDTCDVIGQISTAMLQPAETATLLYLTSPLPPF